MGTRPQCRRLGWVQDLSVEPWGGCKTSVWSPGVGTRPQCRRLGWVQDLSVEPWGGCKTSVWSPGVGARPQSGGLVGLWPHLWPPTFATFIYYDIHALQIVSLSFINYFFVDTHNSSICDSNSLVIQSINYLYQQQFFVLYRSKTSSGFCQHASSGHK